MKRLGIVLAVGFGSLTALGACGSNVDNSDFPDTGVLPIPDSGTPVNPDIPDGSSGDAQLPDSGFTKCASATVAAEKIPFHLVVVFDRSSSMCCYPGGRCYSQKDPNNPNVTLPAERDCARPDSRWGVSTAALKSFFANAKTTGSKASIVAFPKRAISADANSSADSTRVCKNEYYDGNDLNDLDLIKDVELYEQGLPSNTASSVLIKPDNGGFTTPTKHAVNGATTVARKIQAAAGAGEKTALLLFTDGYPQWCETQSNDLVDSIANVNAEVSAALGSGFKTYVIGVSSGADSLTNLNSIARAGDPQAPATGDAAYLISVNDPAAAATQLANAFDTIRTKAASCSVKVPAPPAGETLDPKKVNVILTSGGVKEDLAYSSDCTDANGWHYDNLAAPKTIDLCPGACKKLQNDPASNVDVVLGCETRGDIGK